MDAKLDNIVDQFKARLDELVPEGCREKSLAATNIEQAQLWAERARNASGDNPLKLAIYDGEQGPWKGCIEGKGGVEFWIGINGELVPATVAEVPVAVEGQASA